MKIKTTFMLFCPKRLFWRGCRSSLLALAVSFFCAGADSVLAQIRTDGSLGHAAQTLNGPNYLIPETLGKLSGNNLFQSFQTFNVRSGESAIFSTVTPGIANVISRVTGGELSQINGRIQLSSVGASPDFYLINPAGVVFGAGAMIDVPGSFFVSTANSVKFPEGHFNADLSQASTFSSAAPEAFGFLGTTRGSITLRDGAILSTQNGRPISIIAGDIDIAGATVTTVNGGDVRIAALGQSTLNVPLNGALPEATGNLTVLNGGLIETSNTRGYNSGNITVRAGSIRIASGGEIDSSTSAASQAGTVKVSAEEIVIDGKDVGHATGIFSAANAGIGAAGDVAVVARQHLALTNGGEIFSMAFSSGNSGVVTVNAGNLSLSNGSLIASAAYSSGKAESVSVRADHITLDGQGSPTGIYNLSAYGLSKAGEVNVVATENLSLINGGQISSSALSSSDGGTIKVSAGRLLIDGQSSNTVTGIFSAALSGTGNAGDVAVTATQNLSLVNGGQISSDTLLSGNAGSVKVSASSMDIDGAGSGVFSEAKILSRGHGGDIDISVSGKLALSHGALISSSTFSSGKAGTVTVKADSLSIDRQGGSDTGIYSEADYGSGDSGNVNVTTLGNLSIINGGVISSSTYSSGNGGVVTVNAGNIAIAGGEISSSTRAGVAIDEKGVGGARDALVREGNAGNVEVVTTGHLAITDGGGISSNAESGSGRAGTVTVRAGTLLVDGMTLLDGMVIGPQSAISALAGPYSSGQTGSVSVTANEITLSNGGQISITNSAIAANPDALTPTSITVVARRIEILDYPSAITTTSFWNAAAGSITVSASDQLQLRDSAITTTANQGNGGSINITSGIIRLNNAQISTSVAGLAGNGGDISLNANALILNTGFIQANTAAHNASGGKVNINVAMLVPSGNTLSVGGQVPLNFWPGIFGFNVIQAAAPTGVSGTVQMTSPVLDLSGNLVGLNTKPINTGGLGRNPCQTTGGSSLSLSGRGGLPSSARGLLRAETSFWPSSNPDNPALFGREGAFYSSENWRCT
jgi:filamentous hemagglutinin family protein